MVVCTVVTRLPVMPILLIASVKMEQRNEVVSLLLY